GIRALACDASVLPRPRAGARARRSPLGHATVRRDAREVDARDRQGAASFTPGLYRPVELGLLEAGRSRDGPEAASRGGDPADVRGALRAPPGRERREGGGAARRV